MARLDDYEIKVHTEDNGSYVAHIPAVPGCHAWGRSVAEARGELAHVFDMIRDECHEEGRVLPVDGERATAHAG